MHMADALISPAVGGTMWAATAGLTAYSAKKLKKNLDEHKVPLMGVLGAFIFAAQMINFTIPATGSSGHLAGGMILAILLGPYAAFLTIASVITIQALFFADGGLLALGCNIINMGGFACFIAYPLIYKKLAGARPTKGRILLGALVASILALQMGAFGVVLETLIFRHFGIVLYQLSSIHAAHPPGHRHRGGAGHRGGGEFCLEGAPGNPGPGAIWRHGRVHSHKPLLLGLALFAVVTGGGLSWFASTHPDGLEWSVKGVTGKEELEAPKEGAHGVMGRIQERLSFLPDYDFKKPEGGEGEKEAKKDESWPNVSTGKSLAGILGAAMTLLLAGVIGFGLRRYYSHSK